MRHYTSSGIDGPARTLELVVTGTLTSNSPARLPFAETESHTRGSDGLNT
jgi:hypothetical protein